MHIKFTQRVLIIMLLNTTPFLQAAEQTLPVCKNSPNCVSSQASDAEHSVAPFKLRVQPELAWQKLRMALIASDRTIIVDENNFKLHAEATSLIFRFVDDVYALLDPQKQVIDIYSASRVGYGDFGVNRKRVEALRQKLQQEGVID